MPDIDIVLKGTNNASKPINQVNQDIGNLNKTAESTSKGGLGNLVGTMGTALKVGAAAGVTALAGLGTAVGVAGVHFDNMKQQAQIAFTTMLGDGNKAKVFLDDLQQFAASTPFDFPELLSASQRLLAMGFAAEDVKPTLTAVGDAVAGLGGSGEMVGRVTTALGQMQAKGKASAEEMMQLTEAGIPGWEFLAKAIGTDVAGAMDAVSKGTVSADVAVTALTEGMTAKFGGLMEAQSHTFGGLLSTIQDTFQQVSGTVMEPFFGLMTSGLQSIVDWTSSPEFTGGVERFTRMVELASQAIGVFFGDMSSGESVIDSLTHALAYLLPPKIFLLWEDFAGVVKWATDKFIGLMDVISGKANALTYFSDLWEDVWGAAKDMFGSVVNYVQTNLPSWIAKLQEWSKAAWEWIAGAAPKVLEALGKWAGGIISWLGAKLPDFIATVYKWATALVDWIAEAVPRAIDGISDFVRGLRGEGDSAGGKEFSAMAGGWATTLWTWIKDDLIPKVGPAFMDFIRSLINYGQTLLTSLGGLAKEMGLTLWQWIVDITPTAVDKLREWGDKLWGWIKSNAPEWGRKLLEWGNMAWEWIVDASLPALKKLSEWGAALWDWVKEHAPDWWNKLKEWAALAWRWITDIAIPEAKKKLGEWGTALWGWLTENAPKWRDKLLEWGNMAWEWIRDVAIPGAVKQLDEWGRKFTEWVTTNWPIWKANLETAGQNIIDGLRAGIEKKWGELMSWWKTTAIGAFIGDFEDMFGIHSPSRVFWGYGADIIEGLALGIEATAERVRDGMDAIAGRVRDETAEISESARKAGSDIARALGNGLKSEAQWVAEQIKATMALANSEMLAATEYFTQQQAVKIEAMHYKLRMAAVETTNLVKQLGLDPKTMPASMGGTGKVVGFGPNGELIMEGAGNKLPGSKPATGTGTNFVPEDKEFTSISEALGGNSAVAQAAAQSIELLGGLTLTAVDLTAAKAAADAAAKTNKKTLDDFLAGISGFLKDTLEGAKGVFGYFNLQESKAKSAGTLKEYINGEVNQTKMDLRGLYQGIQNSVADILGISTSELNVTGVDSARLLDRIKQISKGTTGETDMDFIQQLLQSSVNFRSMANYGTPGNYFGSELPTDPRLTGGKETVNNFNITMQGSGNATGDTLSLVSLLNSLYGTAT